MATPGQYSSLNLGPLLVGPGAFVGLNLGVEWSVDPPEPVIRGVRNQVALAWSRGAGCRQLVRMGWGASEALVQSQAMMWRLAPTTQVSAAMGWGMAAQFSASAAFSWAGRTPNARRSLTLGWRSLALVRRDGVLPWHGRQCAANASITFSWASLPIARAQARLSWAEAQTKLHLARRLLWSNPGLTRRYARLPWGSASGVPWWVGPKPGPGPEPDPDPQFPGGAYVGLNLGCRALGIAGFAPLNLGINACYAVRPQRRTYVVINEASVVRLPDRTLIDVSRVSISSSVDAWGHSFDLELANPAHAALLMPTAAGPRQIEVDLNGYVWTALVESQARRREWGSTGVTLTGRSRTALLAAPYAPARVKATTEERSMAQLVAEELADTGYAASYDTADWLVPAGAWFYDGFTALDAISGLADASGAVVQSDPASTSVRVRARYPASPWLWKEVAPDHVLQEDYVVTESVQMRSAPLYDAVVVTGELAGKGVTAKIRKGGEAGQLFAPQASSPLINTAAAASERGRNILSDRGEQALIELSLPLFPLPLRSGEVGRILPLDLVQVLAAEGTWHGLCTASRIEVRAEDAALVVEQIITLERHYTDAD